ncbi:MAG TPA: right-handed parallel beta-helix repeat-containing protein [Clostridia bacterium]|nr:right-handed parallel beta-helix repeat-containing protein [Clostridia bacterium]
MKKILSPLLAFLILFSLTACVTQPIEPAQTATPTPSTTVTDVYTSPTPTYDDLELARAVSLGIGTYAEEHTITYKDFFSILDHVVELANPTALASWSSQFPTARGTENEMTRQDGMLAIFYASQAAGGEYCKTNVDWTTLNNRMGESAWDGFSWNYPLFPGWDQPTKLDNDEWDTAMVAAYFYSMGKASMYSNQLLFEYDYEKNSLRPSEPFLYSEALCAALRLHDSGLSATDRVQTDEDVAILHSADERREQILHSSTDVTVTGTSYYVSNSGNDSNDGKSPETPWATIDKVNNTDFKSGDSVFFERGGVFRGKLWPKSDLTYSAYGEGPKPCIYGSPENGADPSKWELLEGADNIWVFYKDMYDIGGIFFDDGESWATRKTALWDGTQYVDVVDHTTPIDIRSLDDRTFFSLPDYTGYSSEEAILELGKTSKLYLRCDDGNPGEVYNSIEFNTASLSNVQGTAVLQTGNNVVIDNLCLMYSAGGISVASGCVVQNCEVAWIGGAIAGFSGSGLGADQIAVIRFGDGILIAQGEDSAVRNNYVHHTYDFGITTETGAWQEDKDRYSFNATFEGNLVERCSGGLLVGDWDAMQKNRDSALIFDQIAIKDNYCLYMGYGWSHLTPDYDWGVAGLPNNSNASLILAFPPAAGQNISVENNVFYLSRYSLIGERCGGNTEDYTAYPASFSGNTYVQNNLGLLMDVPNGNCIVNVFYSLDAKEQIAQLLGDTAAIISAPQMPN